MSPKLTIRSLLPRVLQLAGALLFFSAVGWAQITLVHVTACGPQAFPTTTCTIPATGTGNVLVVGWTSANGGGAATISGVTDNVQNIYQEAGSARATDSGGNTMTDIWYAENSVSGATTVTITPSPSGSGTAVIWELSGVEPFSPLDQTSVLNSQSATTTPSGASVVTTLPTEVIISIANSQGTITGITSGNSFTNDSTASSEGWAHYIASSAGTYAPQWTASTSGTYCSSTVSFKAASTGGGACDLNQDGVINVVDVQLATNMDIGTLACPVSLNGGVCGSALVQDIVNAALGQGCSVTISHSVSLTWTASTTAGVTGYNVWRSTTSGGPYTQLNTTTVAATSYTDTSVSAGQIYYYVVTAVDGSNQSADSSQAQATVPTDL